MEVSPEVNELVAVATMARLSGDCLAEVADGFSAPQEWLFPVKMAQLSSAMTSAARRQKAGDFLVTDDILLFISV